jgi:hypothetical protein
MTVQKPVYIVYMPMELILTKKKVMCLPHLPHVSLIF